MPPSLHFIQEVTSKCLNEHLNKTGFVLGIPNEDPKIISISAWDKFSYMIGATKLTLHI